MPTILLTNQTVGQFNGDCEIGDTVTVSLHDENGLPIEVIGEVEGIIDEDDLGYLDSTLDGANNV